MAELQKNEIRCSGCGKAVNENAKRCPYCGYKLKDNAFIAFIKAVFSLLILGGGIYLLISGLLD